MLPPGRMMKTLVVFGILLHVSLHSLAAVIEVFDEADSVLLPCFYGGLRPEDPSVIWTRNGPNPSVFLLRQGGDDPRGQNQIYRGRTSMNPDALDTGNYSLTFRDPQVSDTGSYVCSISDGIKELKLTEVQLNVKDDQREVKMNKDADSVILPCKTSANLPKDTKVEWTRSEPEFMFVHVYPNTSRQCTAWDDLYCGRTRMNEDLLRTGDLSLTLRFPSARDIGRYICTIYRDKDILRQRVVLEQVKHLDPKGLPTWVTVLVLLIVLLGLAVSAGVLYHFRHYFMPVPLVEVNPWEESVLLPCRTIADLPRNTRVEWRVRYNRKVHVHQNGSDQPQEQHQLYRTRTRMNEDLLRTGDLSLTLRRPTKRDNKTYTCIVYSGEGRILMKKQVRLEVKVPQQVNVDSWTESVLLPCRTRTRLSGDPRVEWMDSKGRMVHVYQNGADQPGEQHQFYRTRTEIKEDLLRTGDLSLTLRHLTNEDIYTCIVSNREGNILMRKNVWLLVEVPLLEVDSGEESVLLPCGTTRQLPGDARVEWSDSEGRMVHVYQNGSDQPGEQHQFYSDRTNMNGDLLRTGDLSLTLRWPTDGDTSIYTCIVSSREGVILMRTDLNLRVRVRRQYHKRNPVI